MAVTWVLGGGGIGGIAWETGILAGLAAEGVTVAPDATVLGTSAGATVAAQLASGTAIAELYDRQLAGVPWEPDDAHVRLGTVLFYARSAILSRTAEHAAQRIGVRALEVAADTGERLGIIRQRLPSHEWGALDIRLVAVDAESGEHRVFTAADGVPLVDAVAASCAIPLEWPTVAIEGRHYMDGGMRSTLNLDLAPGEGPVVALAPSTAALGAWGRIDRQREALGRRQVVVIERDRASARAQGGNILDPSVVPAVALAGYEQGRRSAGLLHDE